MSIRFITEYRAAASVEFAITGLAFFAFLLAIINMGLLGFSLNALTHGVQAAARAASMSATNQYISTGSYVCPSASTIAGYFSSIAEPALPPASIDVSGNPYIMASWVNNTANADSTEPPGLYLSLTGTYNWSPLGFKPFGIIIPLRITTISTVMGTSSGNPPLASSC